MFPLRLSFRAKLLVALVGTVGLLLTVILAVVRQQTRRQIGRVVAGVTTRSRQAFAEQERVLDDQLVRLGLRLAEGVRVLAALQASLEAGDPGVLAAAAGDELKLSGFERGLAAFTDAEGRAFITFVAGRPVGRPQAGEDPLVRRVVRERAADAFGYRMMEDTLYAVHVLPLEFFGRLLGTLTLGFPVGDDFARDFGSVIDAEVCFVAQGHCVASTAGAVDSALRSAMIAQAGATAPRLVAWSERRWIVVSDPLSLESTAGAWRVVAIPVDEVLTPLERIGRASRFAGAGSLALALVLAVILSRGLTNPVRELVAATTRVGRGEFDTRVEVRSRDEIGTLAGAFNEMTHGLFLKEQYRALLDKVVSPEVAEELLKGEVSLGGETREVTTLFADIRGFTALTEGMAPEKVITLLNQFMEQAAAAIEAEGGVLDKYVGDEVMALFGAPVAHSDDPARAVHAALRMVDALRALNHERERRGEAPIRVGIGINTGLAIAGNLGTPDRLNYTVLGESVNLASRLCAEAAAFETLVSGTTYERVRDTVDARPLGRRMLKGLSYPVEVYAVEGLRPDGLLRESPAPPRSVRIVRSNHSPASGAAPAAERPAQQSHDAEVADAGRPRSSGEELPGDGGRGPGGGSTGDAGTGGPAYSLLLAVTLLALSTGVARAQEGPFDLPTLADLGLRYSSPGGSFQVELSGRLDLEGYVPQDDPPWIIPETRTFAGGRASLFLDLFAGRHLYALAELRADRGEAPADRPLRGRVEQAFLRVQPWTKWDLHLQAGKFASPFGGYAQRHHTVADPFIRPPLVHEYRTMVCPSLVPRTNDGFIGWKDRPDIFRPIGAPIVWGVPYQAGLMVFGTFSRLHIRAALMNSALSSEPGEWDLDLDQERAPSTVLHLAYQWTPELRAGISYHRGPYLEARAIGGAYPSRFINEYDQETVGFEVTFSRGWSEIRGELLLDRWEVPNVADEPREVAYYAEAKLKLSPGLYGALRYGAIDFNRIARTDGRREEWDFDTRRWQLGAGYQLSRNAGLQAEYAWTFTQGPADPADDLFALRLWWNF
ncbi:MAG: HAMP domain-containing protein [Gemmatimonadetes bacterium]|nr:HAMP domain-containing protein [Gemmatimonadota bacterium]